MGFATSVELARKGYSIIMACRDAERGRQALTQAMKQSKSKHLELMLLDLASIRSIRAFARQFQEKYETLDILINNAGVMSFKRATTLDGFESMLGVNHLGHFLLTNLLLDQIKKSEQGRIITVASSSHTKGKIDFQDPFRQSAFSFMEAYGQSKLANLLFTLELSERLKGTRVTANCLDPGTVSTNIGVNRQNGLWAKWLHALMRPFVQSPLQGAETAIYLADSPEVEGASGQYFQKKRVASVSADAQDKQLASELWEWSERVLKDASA